MQIRAFMIKSIWLRLRGSGFVRECILFDCKNPYYWFLGIMVWGSMIMFVYASLALIRLGI